MQAPGCERREQPTLERLDTVEIEPYMAEGARHFSPINDRTFEDPRSHVIFDDAKAYFAAAEGSYDIVVSEPSNPWVAGVSSLFTVEFYEEIERYLAKGGVLAQWMHGYELSDELLLGVLAAVDRQFADYRVYRVGDRDWLILASPEDDGVGNLTSAPLEQWPLLTEEAKLLGMTKLDQIDALLVANDELLRPYLAGIEPNRDTRPLLDNGAERARFFRESAEALLELRFIPLPLIEVLGGETRQPYVTRISDQREDRHILDEPERALLLMRLFERGDRRAYAGGASMRSYLTQRDNLERELGEDGDGPVNTEIQEAWFMAVYAVYHEAAPWIDLENSQWWADVLAQAKPERVGDAVARGVMLLDAALREQGPQLRERAIFELESEDSLLHPRFTALAGALGVVLEGGDRRGYAQKHMRGLVEGEASEDLAYEVVVAWMEG
ncbi:MAG: hypothetical protein HC927_11950 [Deltaproteobacteria bacterium]|nr:hypothetical protein [Deltaproteobacteria bacterium]